MATPAQAHSAELTRRAESGRRPFLDPVVESMVAIHAARGRGVFAFTAPNRGAGTTYVVELVASELARQYDCAVAVVPASALASGDSKELPQGYMERGENIWMAIADHDLAKMPEHLLEHVSVSHAAENFDFVLLDCPALAAGASALRWPRVADGTFLVIEAGTRAAEIERAQAHFGNGAGRLEGIILNRRTYAIPKFIYQLL